MRLDMGRPAAHLRELAGLSLSEAAEVLGRRGPSSVHTAELRERGGDLCSLRTLLERAEAYCLDLRIVVRGRWVLRGDDDNGPLWLSRYGEASCERRRSGAMRYATREKARAKAKELVGLGCRWASALRPVRLRRAAKRA